MSTSRFGAAGLERRLGGLPLDWAARLSDKRTAMPNDTHEKVVCLRNSRIGITILNKIHVAEAKHVAHDINVRLSQLPLVPAVSTSA
jgi:hypothetical protein